MALAATTAPLASASSHSVDLTQTCKENYKQPTAKVAMTPGKYDAWSFYCYVDQPNQGVSASLPANVQVALGASQVPLGDLVVQAYSNKHYPGSKASGQDNIFVGPIWMCE